VVVLPTPGGPLSSAARLTWDVVSAGGPPGMLSHVWIQLLRRFAKAGKHIVAIDVGRYFSLQSPLTLVAPWAGGGLVG
jgi:hypothetical protein